MKTTLPRRKTRTPLRKTLNRAAALALFAWLSAACPERVGAQQIQLAASGETMKFFGTNDDGLRFGGRGWAAFGIARRVYLRLEYAAYFPTNFEAYALYYPLRPAIARDTLDAAVGVRAVARQVGIQAQLIVRESNTPNNLRLYLTGGASRLSYTFTRDFSGPDPDLYAAREPEEETYASWQLRLGAGGELELNDGPLAILAEAEAAYPLDRPAPDPQADVNLASSFALRLGVRWELDFGQ